MFYKYSAKPLYIEQRLCNKSDVQHHTGLEDLKS